MGTNPVPFPTITWFTALTVPKEVPASWVLGESLNPSSLILELMLVFGGARGQLFCDNSNTGGRNSKSKLQKTKKETKKEKAGARCVGQENILAT